MSRPVVRPYPVIPPDLVQPEQWEVFINGAPESGSYLREFTPHCEVSVRRRLHLKPGLIRQACGLSRRFPLAATLSWYSDGTARRGRVVLELVSTLDSPETVELACTIPGAELAGRLELRARIVALAAQDTMPGAPACPRGAILWDDDIAFSLSGVGSQFPVEIVDFQLAGLPQGAAWYLDWLEADWHRPVLGHVRLLVNEKATAVAAAARTPLPGAPELRLLKVIQADVARTMIQAALADPEFLGESAWEPGTTGAVVRMLVDGLFGGLEAARQIEARSGALLAAHIQSGMPGRWDE